MSQHAWPEPPLSGQWGTGGPGLGGPVLQIQAQIPTEFGRLGDTFSLRPDQSFTFFGTVSQSPALWQVMSLADIEPRLFFVSLVVVLRCLNNCSLWFQPLRVSKPGVSSHRSSVVSVWCGECSVLCSCIEGLRCQLSFIIIIFMSFSCYKTSANTFVAACKLLCSHLAHYQHQDQECCS